MLDGMHEGLLIVNKQKLNKKRATTSAGSVAFCNKPAQRLIGNFVGSGLGDNTGDSFIKLSNLKRFAPMKQKVGS